MNVTKPFIRLFKGIPLYISWFVIYATKSPMIQTRALTLETEPSGIGKKKISGSSQTLDMMSFFDASMKYLKMLDKKFDITEKEEEKS